jgi:hypothetical protein
LQPAKKQKCGALRKLVDPNPKPQTHRLNDPFDLIKALFADQIRSDQPCDQQKNKNVEFFADLLIQTLNPKRIDSMIHST